MTIFSYRKVINIYCLLQKSHQRWNFRWPLCINTYFCHQRWLCRIQKLWTLNFSYRTVSLELLKVDFSDPPNCHLVFVVCKTIRRQTTVIFGFLMFTCFFLSATTTYCHHPTPPIVFACKGYLLFELGEIIIIIIISWVFYAIWLSNKNDTAEFPSPKSADGKKLEILPPQKK